MGVCEIESYRSYTVCTRSGNPTDMIARPPGLTAAAAASSSASHDPGRPVTSAWNGMELQGGQFG